MIRGFSVSNFRSFNDTQSISWVPSKIVRHKKHIFESGKGKVLKGSLIFGANAGGKSNLVHAIDFAKNVILNGTDSVNSDKCYFRVDGNNYNIPGVFQFDILIDNEEYSYGFAISYATKTIISEWLSKKDDNGNDVDIFNRDVDDNGVSHVSTDIEIQSEDEKKRLDIYFEDFGENITVALKKKTMLNDIALRYSAGDGVFRDIAKVFGWFINLLIIFPSSKYNGIIEDTENDELRQLLSSMLNYFDTGIEHVNNTNVDFDKIMGALPIGDFEELKTQISNDLLNSKTEMLRINDQLYKLVKDDKGNTVAREILSDHGNPEDQFEYGDESDGTQRLFDLIPLFYKTNQNKVVIIDEIDRSLHTNAVRRFIELFFSLTEGTDRQIIATTHDSNLLDLDLMRQDEIWFVERDFDHSSKIYSLNRFKERFDKKVNKEYLLGRYGAIPVFKEGFEIVDGVQ